MSVSTLPDGAVSSRRLAADRFHEELQQRTDRTDLWDLTVPQARARFRGTAVVPRLQHVSRLFRLSPDDVDTRREVIEAYLADAALHPTLADALERVVRGAIRAGLKVEDPPRAINERLAILETKWGQVVQELPRLRWSSPLTLDARRAAAPPEALLRTLQEDFQAATASLVTAFHGYLHELVREQYLGVIEWTAEDVCWYGYCRHGMAEDVRTRQRVERSATFTRTIEVRNVHRQHFREYHEHHLYEARAHTVAAYQEPLPSRVADWLTTVPTWLTPHLRIVDGLMLQERIVREDLAEERFVTEKVISVVRNYSPAVCFGPVVLVGWNGADIHAADSWGISPAEADEDPETRLLREAGIL